MREHRHRRAVHRHPLRQWSSAACCIALLSLSGCASTPEPVAEIATARAAVSAVEDVDVQRLAPVQLDRAKTKLARAEEALDDRNYDEARRLAEESLADARLARAQADALSAQRSASELEQSIEVLRSEIDRARSVN